MTGCVVELTQDFRNLIPAVLTAHGMVAERVANGKAGRWCKRYVDDLLHKKVKKYLEVRNKCVILQPQFK